MRIAVVHAEFPNTEYSTVSYSAYLFVTELREAGHDVVVVLPLGERSLIADDETRARWAGELEALGVEVRIVPGEVPVPRRRFRGHGRLSLWRGLVRPRIADTFPQHALRGRMAGALADLEPDVVLLWGGFDVVAATDGVRVAPRFAFVGDPVHLSRLFRERLPSARRRRGLAKVAAKVELRRDARAMLELLRRCEGVAATAAHHAEWYRRNGVSDCTYLRNPVADWGGVDWRRRRTSGHRRRAKVVLMGHVRGTATLAGLYFAADEVVPALERRLGDAFEVHVCGKGELSADLAATLDRPNVLLRGFVDDIVAELLDCDVFLVPTPIELGIRVRIPYAWSCGTPVVAHRANAAGLPELVHGVNCLLGGNGEDVAEHVAAACRDAALRERLGQEGRRTYETHFTPQSAIADLARHLERVAGAPAPAGVLS